MTPETIFQLANSLALVGWIILIILPGYRMDKLIIGVFITLLAIVYTWFVFTEFTPGDMKSFGSLEGVMGLFQNPKILLAGWVHYLAFDLLAGLWIKNNAIKHNISHWLIIPCLIFTFLLGPFGLLIYLVIRTIAAKRYFSDNF